ncbi:MAG: hypothetical protein KJ749_04750, partial [Planctomycetes bacterium]|nr:hypothetical protein [Planctomycetota bacterium]
MNAVFRYTIFEGTPEYRNAVGVELTGDCHTRESPEHLSYSESCTLADWVVPGYVGRIVTRRWG